MNFDEKAREWDKDPDRAARARAFADEIIRESEGRDYSSALEFGSGTGNVSIRLISKFPHITLADTSAGMTEVLREKIARLGITNMNPFLITDSSPLSGLGKFDVIYTLLTLHHIKDTGSIFGEFNNLLKPGGMLFIGDLVTEDGSFHHRDPEFDGHKGFDIRELKEKLKVNGLVPVSDRIFYTIEREHDSKMKEYPVFILTARKP